MNPTSTFDIHYSAFDIQIFLIQCRIRILKEPRESLNCLKIIYLKRYSNNVGQLDKIIQENHELISIFVKSIQTAKKNLANEKVA